MTEAAKPFLVSQEGEWALREDLHYDIASNQFIGCNLSIHAFELAQNDQQRSQHRRGGVERFPACPLPITPFKYFDVSIQMDPTGLDKGFLGFFRDPNAQTPSTPSPTTTNGKAKAALKIKSPNFGKTAPAPAPAPPVQAAPAPSPNTVVGILSAAATTAPVPGGSVGNVANGFPSTAQQAFPAFIQKIVAHEHLAKLVSHARQHGNPTCWINVGKAMVWFDYFCRPKDPWCILYFNAFPTCHDVARDTMDVIVGFNTGDVVFYSPISGRFARMNKASVYTVSTRFSVGTTHAWSSVTSIKWAPGSDTLFWVGFDDGTVLIMDKDKEEAVDPLRVPLELGVSEQMVNPPSPKQTRTESGIASNALTWAQQDTSFVSFAVPTRQKIHPQHFFKVGRKSVSSIQFSPDGQHVAITTLDGLLRVIVVAELRLKDTFPSYFGGLLTCAWSPDGRFLATGGQDDMLAVYAVPLRSLVLRGQGHASWVTKICFDSQKWSERGYTMVSVGEDGKICFWDLDVLNMKRPRGVVRHCFGWRMANSGQTLRRREQGAIVHALQPRADVPMMGPISAKIIHSDPLTDCIVRDDAIVTCCRGAFLRWWARPQDLLAM